MNERDEAAGGAAPAPFEERNRRIIPEKVIARQSAPDVLTRMTSWPFVSRVRETPEQAMKLIAGVRLADVVYRPFTVNEDARGGFTEVFCDSWGLPITPAQWSVVTSHPRVLRGMHLHLRHHEAITVIQGRALVGLYDLRETSATSRQFMFLGLDGDSPGCLAFPPGILHGWYFPMKALHLQSVSESWADYRIDDNWGCTFNDPELGIPWPDPSPILSKGAAEYPSLRALCARMAGGPPIVK